MLKLGFDLSLEDLICLGDEIRHFNLDVRPDDLSFVRIFLFWLLLVVVIFDIVVKLVDEGFGEVIRSDHLLEVAILEDF